MNNFIYALLDTFFAHAFPETFLLFRIEVERLMPQIATYTKTRQSTMFANKLQIKQIEVNFTVTLIYSSIDEL